ncbi:MAG: S1-like domain-containing RNA-binding protein [Bacteroidales bacterium]|nr:S1-like domain-containing RNA-binding protein [Bacteroidales bacterium]MDD4712604.1 S1-like domain-containing RNA-binding protein [Bacteroidales bacterium]
MAILGKMNPLKVVKTVEFGVYVDGGSDGEILLPTRYVPENCQIGDTLSVFIYTDSEDRLIATTLKPYAMVGEFACLEVQEVNEVGAFLDWGLMKQLLVPFREQHAKMREGGRYPVFIYVDFESKRITASAKLEKFIDDSHPELEANQQVDLMIYKKTDLGWKVIVNQQYSGVLYKNEVFQPLEIGQKLTGFVKQIREDDKIDLILQKPGFEKIDDFAVRLHELLKEANGFLPLTDKSPVEEIYNRFGISKKTYKKAVGDLYKKHLIVLEENGIRLVK